MSLICKPFFKIKLFGGAILNLAHSEHVIEDYGEELGRIRKDGNIINPATINFLSRGE